MLRCSLEAVSSQTNSWSILPYKKTLTPKALYLRRSAGHRSEDP